MREFMNNIKWTHIFPDIDRAALIGKLKKPFIDWLVYTSKEHDGEDQMNYRDTIEWH